MYLLRLFLVCPFQLTFSPTQGVSIATRLILRAANCRLLVGAVFKYIRLCNPRADPGELTSRR